jgi:hypothetical protein
VVGGSVGREWNAGALGIYCWLTRGSRMFYERREAGKHRSGLTDLPLGPKSRGPLPWWGWSSLSHVSVADADFALRARIILLSY